MTTLPPFPASDYWTEAQIVAILQRDGWAALHQSDPEQIEITLRREYEITGVRTFTDGLITLSIGDEVVNPDIYQWAIAYLEQTS